jgi:hypothetical protein
MTRVHFCAFIFRAASTTALVAITLACSGGAPVRPSELDRDSAAAGAVIEGVLMAGPGGSTSPRTLSTRSVPSSTPLGGVTVRIVGTSLETVADNSGSFRLADVPAGTVRLQFRAGTLDATTELTGVGGDQAISLQVQIDGSSAVIVAETREAKVVVCHADGSGSYQMISIGESAEPAHRAHGDAERGEAVPGRSPMVFGEDCAPEGPEVRLEKSTNGEDADQAPGPEVIVGSPIEWTYRVSNMGTVALTSVAVSDDQGVVVSCPSASLAAGASMICSGAGAATLGQYRNVGTVTASYTFNGESGQITAVDPSHYRGVAPEVDEPGATVTLCHRTGAGFYVKIEVGLDAEPSHIAHGDGRIGQAVPGVSGRVFTATCGTTGA